MEQKDPDVSPNHRCSYLKKIDVFLKFLLYFRGYVNFKRDMLHF